ncbi:ATP-binding protein [Ralstonia pseudosolanacearum]|uniref:ATP-binding protein n=1 Tax=Ralstonia pseudosolanacearum TaxID=1310165 RepID=UPI003CF65827
MDNTLANQVETLTNQVSPMQLETLLAAYIPAHLPVLVTGAPGVGKSDIAAAAADRAGYDLLISHPVVEDPTDSKGLPFPSSDGQAAKFLPFGDLERVLQAKKPLVWFFDDLGQASPAVQAAKMQLLLARRIGEHKLPDHVTFLAATNRRTDNAGVSGILDPVKSRFATIVELVPNIDAWAAWAVKAQLPAELIAFLRFKPELLVAKERTRDIENLPSPRGWGMVGKQMPVVPAGLEAIAFTGAVGAGAAVELQAFRETFRSLPSVASVLLAPDTARIPDEPSARIGIATAVAGQTTAANIDRVLVYADRMHVGGHGDCATMLISDAVRRDESIVAAPAFITAQSGWIGAAMDGR